MKRYFFGFTHNSELWVSLHPVHTNFDDKKEMTHGTSRVEKEKATGYWQQREKHSQFVHNDIRWAFYVLILMDD